MKIAFVTQSYKDDYEECKLLCESVDRFVPKDIIHYVFVNDSDYKLFKHLENDRREILPKSVIVPKWLIKYPFKIKGHMVWISPLTIPVRGWIIQQVVKLGAFEYIEADGFVNLDSEVAFIKPFEKKLIVKEEKLLLHRQTREWNYHSRGQYITAASKLLNIPNGEYLWVSWYLSSNFCFTRKSLIRLTEKIGEKSFFKSWKLPLFNTVRFSEYMLYGLFVEHVLGIADSDHYVDTEGFVMEQYPSQYKYNIEGLRSNILALSSNENKVAVLLQKSRKDKETNKSLNVRDYKNTIYEAWDLLNNG